MRALVIAAVLLLAQLALAGDGGRRSGFVVQGPGDLVGKVVTQAGAPLGGIDVYVASRTGTRVVKTDPDGRFEVALRREQGPTYVYVRAVARVSGLLGVSTTVDGHEAVELYDVMPPPVKPRLLSAPNAIPAYSQQAIDTDAWAKAWLLLDVSATGTVTRVKLLTDPGHDLTAIAIRAAFDLRFAPARDLAGHPVPDLMLWSFEWPSYGWLSHHDLDHVRLPPEVASVPCLGSAPARSVYRNCAAPDMASALSRPWIGGE